MKNRSELFIATWLRLIGIVSWSVVLSSAGWSAEVSLKEETVGSNKVYRLENYRVSLVVNPNSGGKVVSYRDKLGGNVELISPKFPSGLCIDQFQSQSWYDETIQAVYESQVIEQAADECTLRVAYTVQGKTNPKLAGLRLEKDYTLRTDSPSLICRIKIANPTKKAAVIDYWNQNIFFSGGSYDADLDKSFRPTTRGVMAKSKQDPGKYGPEDWITDFTDGWIAQLDTKAKSGLVVLTDYNDMRFVYVDGANQTVEPMFEISFLPPQASREYRIDYIPVIGLDNVVAATREYVAGYKMQSDNKGNGTVDMTLVRSTLPVKKTVMQLQAMNAVKLTLTPPQKLAFGDLADTPQTQRSTFANAGVDPLVLQVKAQSEPNNGKTVESRFEDFYCGAYQWGENITVDGRNPFYVGTRPPQEIRINKPAELKLANYGGRRAWYAEGFMDEYYAVTPAIKMTMQYEGPGQPEAPRQSFVSRSSFGDRLTAFPYDYEELFSYNYIVLGGAGRSALGNIGIEMLHDFVQAGGSMVVLGGMCAYADAQWQGTKLEELLPVKIREGKYDIVDVGGAPLTIADTDTLFLQGIDFGAKPCVRYLHSVEVKPGAKVALAADGKPFMVTWEVGPKKARITCILGTPLGTVGQGKTPFWKWQEWRYLMQQLFWWSSRYGGDGMNFTIQ